MRSLAGNLAGLYHLYPSDRFGRWLSVNGVDRDQAGVQSFSTGSEATAACSARPSRTTATSSTGSTTARASSTSGRSQAAACRRSRRSTSSATRPATCSSRGAWQRRLDRAAQERRPARRRAPAARRPGRAPVHVQRVARPASRLAAGPRRVRGLPRLRAPGQAPRAAMCGDGRHVQLPLGDDRPHGARAVRGAFGRVGSRSAAAAGPMGFDDAQLAGLVDVIDAGPRTLVIVDDDLPVTLTTPIAGGTFTYTPLTDSTAGTTLEYGPLTGTLQLDPGAAGALRWSRSTAQPVPGRPVGPTPTPTPDPGPGGGSSPPPAARAQAQRRRRLRPAPRRSPSSASRRSRAPPAHPGPPAAARAGCARPSPAAIASSAASRADQGRRRPHVHDQAEVASARLAEARCPLRRQGAQGEAAPAGLSASMRGRTVGLSRSALCWLAHPDRSALRIPRPILLRLRRRLV